MKYILVTGGAGFIGANLCKKLLGEGEFVIAIDNFITSSSKNSKSLRNQPNFKFIQHDIVKSFPGKLMDALSEVSIIYHLACPTGVPNLTKLAQEMINTCSLGTMNVMELAKKQKASVVFTSSSEVYGDPKEFPQLETYTGNVDPGGIRSPYEEGKRFSESIIAMYVRKYNVNAKIVRVFNTYGPYMSLSDSRVIPNFIKQMVGNEPLTIQGDGLQKRTFCYVDDLVNGLMLGMVKGERGQIYNLGGYKEVSILELAKLVRKVSGAKNEFSFIARPAHDHASRKPDLRKVKSLGWKQLVSLEDGLQKTMEWYGLAAANSRLDFKSAL